MSEMPPVRTNPQREFPYILGIGFISVGLAIFLEQFLKTGWLVLVILPVSGAVFLVEATRTRKLGLLIAGSLIFGVGVGGFLYFSSSLPFSVEQRIGCLILQSTQHKTIRIPIWFCNQCNFVDRFRRRGSKCD